MNISKEKMGLFIRNGRLDLNLTQEQLAEKVNVNLTHLGNIERGKSSPSLDLFFRLIDTLCLSADELLNPKERDFTDTSQQLNQLLIHCTAQELNILLENAKTLIRNRTAQADGNG